MREKRERALNYWKERVTLPPIDKQRESLVRLREERSPERMVSQAIGKVFSIKNRNSEDAAEGWDEEKNERMAVGKLPDKIVIGKKGVKQSRDGSMVEKD